MIIFDIPHFCEHLSYNLLNLREKYLLFRCSLRAHSNVTSVYVVMSKCLSVTILVAANTAHTERTMADN